MPNLKQNFSRKTDIFLLQEPHLYKGTVTGLSGLNTYYFGDHPRATIAVGNDINEWPDPLFSGNDITTITITMGCLLYTSPSPRDRG